MPNLMHNNQSREIFALCIFVTRQGLTQPLYPAAGTLSLHPERDIQFYLTGFFRTKVEKTKNSTTGTMKTEKGVDGNKFPPAPFFLFSPDALHPVGGVPPPARGAGARGSSNSQSFNLLLPREFCVFLGGETAIPQALRASPFTQGSLSFSFFLM